MTNAKLIWRKNDTIIHILPYVGIFWRIWVMLENLSLMSEQRTSHMWVKSKSDNICVYIWNKISYSYEIVIISIFIRVKFRSSRTKPSVVANVSSSLLVWIQSMIWHLGSFPLHHVQRDFRAWRDFTPFASLTSFTSYLAGHPSQSGLSSVYRVLAPTNRWTRT